MNAPDDGRLGQVWVLDSHWLDRIRLYATPAAARAAAEAWIRGGYPCSPITALEWRTAEGDDTEELYATVAGETLPAAMWIFPLALEGAPEPTGDGQGGPQEGRTGDRKTPEHPNEGPTPHAPQDAP